MLFEISYVTANIADAQEGTGPGGQMGVNLSASGNGLDNRLYAQEDWKTSISNQYATGYLGGRPPFKADKTQFRLETGRHAQGSCFLLADGHVKWLRGNTVSSGLNANSEMCSQDNQSGAAGCDGEFHAAGTGSYYGDVRATFSTN